MVLIRVKTFIFVLNRKQIMYKDNNTCKYLIITAAKNEENYIENTLKSVCQQTVLPIQWIIVNDGSTDRTSEIVRKYTKNYSWIKLINNDNYNEKRAGGAKVVRAFYVGYDSLSSHDYDFIVKLDADLTLPQNYFEEVAKEFRNNSKVGLCGGYCSIEKNGKLVKESSASYHLRGPIKAYRKECFDQIGGLKPMLNWDGIDEMTAMFKGWDVKILPLQVIHHRPTSTEINRGIKSLVFSGRVYYKNGHDLLLALLKAFHISVRKKPLVLSGLIFYFNFIYAMIKNEPKNVDKQLAKFIRNFQYNRILRQLHLIK